jgi:phosphate-selective porin OprO/OprP
MHHAPSAGRFLTLAAIAAIACVAVPARAVGQRRSEWWHDGEGPGAVVGSAETLGRVPGLPVVDAPSATAAPPSALPYDQAFAPPSAVASYETLSALQPATDAERLAKLEQELKKLTDAEQSRKASAARRPSFAIGGQLQADYLWFGQDATSRAAVGDIEDFSDFRRARLTASGEAFEVIEYAIGFDFGLAGRPSFLDVYVGVHDLPYVGHFRVGHYFEPFSLERVTQNRYNTFMERSLADAFAPARNLGMEIHDTVGVDERATLAVGWFRSVSDDFGDDAGDEGEQAVTTRATWLPFYDDASNGRSYIHVGGGYSFRDADEGVARFRSTPEARGGALGEGQVPFFVDTGNIPAENWQLLGAEFAWIAGPFSIQSEYMHVPVRQIGGPDLQFQAAYVQATYFLTGEHRPYNKEFGIHGRVVPFENFFRVWTDDGVATGCGAWEVAARWSYIDLDDGNIEGGSEHNYTLGLNWYLNPYTRVKWEYILADLDRAPVGESTTHIAGMRFDIDF